MGLPNHFTFVYNEKDLKIQNLNYPRGGKIADHSTNGPRNSKNGKTKKKCEIGFDRFITFDLYLKNSSL